MTLIVFAGVAAVVGPDAQGQQIEGDVGGQAIALVRQFSIEMPGGIFRLGGKQFDTGGGDCELIAIFNWNDEAKMEKGIKQVIRSQYFNAKEAGDIVDVDRFILAAHDQEDKGAKGGFDQGLDEVV
jgi:hypothetical protein